MKDPTRHRVGALLLAVAAATAWACGSPTDSAGPGAGPDPVPPADSLDPGIPALGQPGTLDIGAWNVEWFGSPDFDPADDALQHARVRDAILALELDIWGLEEVVLEDRWDALVASLPGYAGVLASDPRVDGGPSAYYAKEQKPALLYRTDVARLRDARLVLTDHEHAFAGRPPLQATLDVGLGGRTETVVVLVVHMKAGADAEDRARRETAAGLLKDYLDTALPTERVMVIGDFNDDVDVSIHAGSPTPYAAFVADTARWTFPTGALSAAGIASMTRYPDIVDHQLYSDELMRGYVDGSATVVRLDQWLDRYDATTSDHFPVVTRYAPGR